MQWRRVALGSVLLGLGLLAYTPAIARFDTGLGLATNALAGLGFFVVAAGFLRGPGGEPLVAVGMVIVCSEALLSLTDLGGDLTVLMTLVWAVGMVQATWFAAQWAARPEGATRYLAGFRLGWAFAALSPIGWMLNDLTLADPLWWPGNLLRLAGAVLAVQALAPLRPPPAPAPGAEDGAVPLDAAP